MQYLHQEVVMVSTDLGNMDEISDTVAVNILRTFIS